MRFIFVFLIAILKFGTLKTEPIDYDRKNGQINAIFPPRPNIPKYSHQVDNDWNVNDLKFQPNESTMRKTINIEDIEDYENEVFGKIMLFNFLNIIFRLLLDNYASFFK